jgi:RHS repeat-associated protein
MPTQLKRSKRLTRGNHFALWHKDQLPVRRRNWIRLADETQSCPQYDPFAGLVKIVETASSSITSTKQFVRCGSQICEERNASSVITKQFFGFGQTLSGSDYFYTRDHLGSVRDMTNSSGVVQAHYEYGLYGEQTQTVGTLTADFGYAGYYVHGPSGLNLTTFRAYSPSVGRWINRDPDEEDDGTNLYAYVDNDPTNYLDPDGDIATAPSVGFGPGDVSFAAGPPGGSNNNNGPSNGSNSGGGGGDPGRTAPGHQKNQHNEDADTFCSGKSGAALVACICGFLNAGYAGSSGTARTVWNEARKAAGCKHSRCSGGKKKPKKN